VEATTPTRSTWRRTSARREKGRTTLRRSRVLRLCSLVAAAFAAVAAPSASAGPIVDRAVESLATDPVYVDPAAERAIGAGEAGRIRDRIESADAGPLYVAILPASATDEAGGSVDEVVRDLIRGVGEDGTYAVVVGNSFRAGSNVLPAGEAGQLATRALDEGGDEGTAATLLRFVDLVGDARAGGSGETAGEEGGDGSSSFAWLIPVLAIGGAGFFLFRRRKRREVEDAELAEVKETARDDLVALGEEIRALDLDVEMPGVPEEAKRDYERALTMYERADTALDRARTAEDLEEVSASVEEGRHAILAARARLDGREPPERRPPCFFDPRHGPSAREVEWAPPWGAPRLVPACEADAQRIERGEDPEAREVMVGGQRMPYWNAGPAYAPFAGGFFGGLGGGLLPGLMMGTMLGSAFGGFGVPVAYGDTGDYGGDYGGGDFGGGDFGGGDFGGSDFGGGGDFGGGDF